MTRLFLILFLCGLTAGFLTAQQHNFKIYSVDQGLAQSQVLSLTKDKKGFIWIATQGGGVSKFDGHRFISYSIYEGLPSNHVWKIFCDSKGNIWAGTTEGLAVYKNERFEKVKSTYGLRDDHIYDIAEDKKGNLFFGTKNYGVFIYNGINYKNYAINDGLGFSAVNKIYVDKKGTVWLGSLGYGVATYKGEKFENITKKAKLPALNINEIYNDTDGKLIVCSDEGMFSLQGEVFIPYEKEFEVNSVYSVKIDKSKTTWFATYGNGLIAEDSVGNTQYFNEENGLPTNYLHSLMTDTDGKLWIATDGAGFSRYDGPRFIHYNKSNILKNHVVNNIAVTPDSSYWFATEQGITRYFIQSKKVIHYTSENGLQDDNVHCLDVSPDGTVWAGTESGIIRIYTEPGKESFRFYSLESGVYSICAESNSKIWAGTSDGIFVCNGAAMYKRFRDSIPNTFVYRIKKEETKKQILFCTEISFSVYDGDKLSNYKISDEKGSKEIVDVWPESNKGYWLATNRGLTFINQKNEKNHFNYKNGLSSDNLYLVCKFGNDIWIGGDKGLDRITFNRELEITKIKHYNKEDGFIGIECNAGAVLIEPDKIWFGTIKGVTVFQKKYDFINNRKPIVQLLGIKLNYEKVNWKGIVPGAKIDNNVPVNPLLSYRDNNLLFDFIAIDYANPEKIKYQYKLEGFNENWLILQGETSVSYTNIPPGEYVFKVKAVNADGIWSDVYQYKFTIDVPFWKSKWFYFILIPSVLVLLYVFILFRTRSLNRAKRKLEETVRIRTLEINRQKNELEKLSIVADKMNDGVVICSPDGKIEWINDGFKRMTGFSNEEFFTSDFGSRKLLQEISSHNEIDSIIHRFKEQRDPVIYDSTHQTKTGNVMWTRAALTPIYNERNELIKIVALYSDITNHIRYEETLAQTNKDLTDSIVYAKKIQEAILPEKDLIGEAFPDHFIYYNPRDIVSGDFYWFTKMNGMLILAVADCTGHGVPGAFMSMIGNEFLHQIINNTGITMPDTILSHLNERVMQALHQDGGDSDSRDGMDMAVCCISLTNLFCRFSGAYIPMFLIRNNEIIEYEATKDSVGGHNESSKLFLLNELNLQKGDCIYFTTDGYIDQFGGNDGKKLMRKRWKELIKRYHHLPMKDQHAMLYELHYDWRGNRKQTDDILVIGIRI